MNETTTLGTPPSASTKRNVVLAVCGVALAGLGLAAGLVMHPGNGPAPADVPAVDPGAAPAATVAARTQSPPVQADAVPQPAPPAPRVADATPQAEPAGRPVAPLQTKPINVCSTCGVVEGVREVQKEGQGSGVGAVAGGVLGGVLGNHVGGGLGRAAATVLGAVGGGYAGNEVEKRTRTTTVYDVRVRMDDGSLRTFQRSTPVSPGAHVIVEGHTLRLADTGSTGYGS